MDLIAKREKEDVRFQAKLHGFDAPDGDGRVHGLRQRQMARMKARRGAH